jgi:hypothetical protein
LGYILGSFFTGTSGHPGVCVREEVPFYQSYLLNELRFVSAVHNLGQSFVCIGQQQQQQQQQEKATFISAPSLHANIHSSSTADMQFNIPT